MIVIAAIAEWSFLAFAMLLFATQFLVHQIGYWFGRRKKASGESPAEGVGAVVGSILGLLAFVLALTLSYASTRFGERRQGALAEANAIGTAWLRAQAIGHPRGAEIAHLLEQYIETRKEFVRAGRNRVVLDELNRRTNELQSKIWGNVAAIVRQRPDPISGALMASLNDTFDMTTAERFAYERTLPPQIFWLLIIMSLTGMAALGYQLGLRASPVRMLVAFLMLMWTLVIVDILDLASARLGSFRTDPVAYEWTIQGFKSGVSIPSQSGSR